mmetsp:Transcript_29547/g.47360  ORF Transcript_29547/g.47360 Transcript_29547/m.47360 type:complete len:589 (-) Transcript_29547:84-1850(-)
MGCGAGKGPIPPNKGREEERKDEKDLKSCDTNDKTEGKKQTVSYQLGWISAKIKRVSSLGSKLDPGAMQVQFQHNFREHIWNVADPNIRHNNSYIKFQGLPILNDFDPNGFWITVANVTPSSNYIILHESGIPYSTKDIKEPSIREKMAFKMVLECDLNEGEKDDIKKIQKERFSPCAKKVGEACEIYRKAMIEKATREWVPGVKRFKMEDDYAIIQLDPDMHIQRLVIRQGDYIMIRGLPFPAEGATPKNPNEEWFECCIPTNTFINRIGGKLKWKAKANDGKLLEFKIKQRAENFDGNCVTLPYSSQTSELEEKYINFLLTHKQCRSHKEGRTLYRLVEKAFHDIDRDDSGHIDFKEMRLHLLAKEEERLQLMARAWEARNRKRLVNKDDVLEIFSPLDADGNGSISYKEYVHQMLLHSTDHAFENWAENKKFFVEADKNTSGILSKVEMEKYMRLDRISQTDPKREVTRGDVRASMSVYDLDKDGMITLEEFVEGIMRETKKGFDAQKSFHPKMKGETNTPKKTLEQRVTELLKDGKDTDEIVAALRDDGNGKDILKAIRNVKKTMSGRNHRREHPRGKAFAVVD